LLTAGARIAIFTAMKNALVILLLATSPLAAQQRGLVVANDSGYALQPGDVINVNVWGHEEFSGQFQVNEQGIIEYPGIGELNTNALRLNEVRDTLRTALGNIFNRPFVTVTPLFRMAVLGHIQNPGLYTVDPTMTVFDMIALAGGPSRDGDLNKIRLLRNGENIRFSFQDNALHGRTLQDLGVRSGDQVMVNRKSLTSGDLLLGFSAAQVILSLVIIMRQ
jgi:protein involved in polysaccharide export with SLBB domain